MKDSASATMELTEDVMASMSMGAVFKDYVRFLRRQTICTANRVHACLACLLIELTHASCLQGAKINSLDFHRTEDLLITASDDESIRLYNISSGT